MRGSYREGDVSRRLIARRHHAALTNFYLTYGDVYSAAELVSVLRANSECLAPLYGSRTL